MSVRALVVDDEDNIRGILCRVLEGAGHVAVPAGDAVEARRLLSRSAFDVILCDVNMPGESGLELTQDVLATRPDAAVIMVTGVDDPGVANRALDAGAYGYLVKPFKLSEVTINVDSALRRRRLECDNRRQREKLISALRERTAELWNAVRQVEVADLRAESSFEEVIRRLALAAEMRDEETAEHIERVGAYAAVLGRAAGLDREPCEALRQACRMHDIGKISVPDRILCKRGKLTDEEFDAMKLHSRAGHLLLAGSGAEVLEMAAEVALTHHERWDGSGYPNGRRGDRIPIEGQIAAIADVFDALTSDRVYRRAYPLLQALEIMRQGRGSHFNPELHDLFVASMDEVLEASDTAKGAVRDPS